MKFPPSLLRAIADGLSQIEEALRFVRRKKCRLIENDMESALECSARQIGMQMVCSRDINKARVGSSSADA
jgi:hypothetical protein